jgi:hypothetical protein
MTISEDELEQVLKQRNEHESLRQIARSYDGRLITHGDIGRAIHGRFPVSDAKRHALDIAPICPTCYQVLPKPPRQIPAWLKEVTATLQRLESAAHAPADPIRVYARGGKRVRL